MRSADGSAQQAPNDRLRRRISGQIVQVALNGSGRVFLTHGATIELGEVACRGDHRWLRVRLPRLVMRRWKE